MSTASARTSGRDYRLGRVTPAMAAERLPVLRPGGHDKRTAADYRAELEAEAERSLMRSPRWRAGRPLEDHRDACDCPLTLAGCWERRAWPTSDGLGSRSGVPPHGGPR